MLRASSSGKGEQLCVDALVGLIREKQVEVRVAGQNGLAPLLGLEDHKACSKWVKRFVALRSEDATADQAVHGLGAMLNVAGSLGVPPWLGQVVEALAKVGRRAESKKEVERIVQAFLKQQQASRDLWKRCQSRLTSSQMEVLKDRQGTMSYYS